MMLKSIEQDVLLLLGWLHLQCGHAARARILIEALLALEPAHVAARKILVVCLLHQEEGAEAERNCELLQRVQEQDPALWLCLSRAKQLQGQSEEARMIHESFLVRREHHAAAY
jgi:type III secretion protein Y